jgi:membrane-bound serine protease (ClpP class)
MGPLRALRLLFALTLVLTGMAFMACSQFTAPEGAVHVLTAEGVVNPVMDRYLDRGIDRAEDTGASAIVIRLDTPGGLSSSMEEIIKRMERSEVPVIVYVWPPAGRAASAGTFITMAGQVAAMAPGTRIGAASPVGTSGEDIEGTLGDKIENDAAALIRGIAELRGRNADWAEDAVRDAVSATATEAVELGVVDFIAEDLNDLLAQSDGRTVEVASGRDVVIDVDSAEVVFNDPNFFERFLDLLADPNIAVILLGLGFVGILIEITNPGLIFPGVAGAVALLLAFFSLGTLPYSEAGLALIGLAMLLFILETFVTSNGILGIGGVIALIIGGAIFMSDNPPGFQPSTILMLTIGASLAALFITTALGLARLRRMAPSPAGAEGLYGLSAEVKTPLAPTGFVWVAGENWQATIDEGSAEPGERVRITRVEGLRLHVRKES